MPRLLEHHSPCWIYRLLNFVPDTRTTDDPRQAFFRAANSLLDRVPCSPPSSITEDSRLNSPLEFNPVRGLSRLKKYRKKRGVEKYIYIYNVIKKIKAWREDEEDGQWTRDLSSWSLRRGISRSWFPPAVKKPGRIEEPRGYRGRSPFLIHGPFGRYF